jgi:hypothetical protein
VLQDGTGLFEGDSGEPLDKLGHVGAILQVLEESGHRDTGTSEDPGSAHSRGIALHCWTVRPVNHGVMIPSEEAATPSHMVGR